MDFNENRLKIIGKAFHCLMEFSPDLINLNIEQAQQLIIDFPLSTADQALVLNSIKKLNESEKCSNLLNNSDANHILTESEWANEFGDTLRPDRIDFNTQNKTIQIIDFKWRLNEEKTLLYISQLLNYRKVIELYHPKMSFKSFFVSGDAQIAYVEGDQLLHL